MSNVNSGVLVDLNRDMQIYDMLPDYIRKVICEAPYNVHVEPLARFYLFLKKRGLSKQYIRYEMEKAAVTNSLPMEAKECHKVD